VCDVEEPRIMYDAKGAARAMSISRSGVFLLIARGELNSTVVAGRRLIAHSDLIDLVRRKQEESAAGITTTPTAHWEGGNVGAPNPAV